ncbi:MAG: hypothetical protein ABC378_02855 [Staphylococcus pseudoxylosus]|uniref:hypothetical protein n=1 Tax=Staphylococcus pseudoxylosus TaxID=2282419 RepID=UPI0031F609CD
MDLNQEFLYLTRMIEEIVRRYQKYSHVYETTRVNKINFSRKQVKHFIGIEHQVADTTTIKKMEIIDRTIFKEIEIFKNLINPEDSSVLIEEELSILNTYRRIKNDKSIYQKLAKYMSGVLEGGVPIRKCLNDLLGYRFIFTNNLEFDELFLKLKGIIETDENLQKKVKVLDSSKDTYRAVHLYFKGKSNSTFPCELQVWLNEDEKTNTESHDSYKQDYLHWGEKEIPIIENKRGE